MDTMKPSEEINQDRRQLLGTAAMGIAVASLLPGLLDSAGATHLPNLRTREICK
jgi:hypothetical protein